MARMHPPAMACPDRAATTGLDAVNRASMHWLNRSRNRAMAGRSYSRRSRRSSPGEKSLPEAVRSTPRMDGSASKLLTALRRP